MAKPAHADLRNPQPGGYAAAMRRPGVDQGFAEGAREDADIERGGVASQRRA